MAQASGSFVASFSPSSEFTARARADASSPMALRIPGSRPVMLTGQGRAPSWRSPLPLSESCARPDVGCDRLSVPKTAGIVAAVADVGLTPSSSSAHTHVPYLPRKRGPGVPSVTASPLMPHGCVQRLRLVGSQRRSHSTDDSRLVIISAVVRLWGCRPAHCGQPRRGGRGGTPQRTRGASLSGMTRCPRVGRRAC